MDLELQNHCPGNIQFVDKIVNNLWEHCAFIRNRVFMPSSRSRTGGKSCFCAQAQIEHEKRRCSPKVPKIITNVEFSAQHYRVHRKVQNDQGLMPTKSLTLEQPHC